MSHSSATNLTRDYERVARAIRYIHAERLRHPSLEEIATHVGLSPHHLQRIFQRWAGISPKRLLQYLTLEHARHLLRREDLPLLETAIETGLSGPGRLHDLFVNLIAVTPGDDRRQGAGLDIRYGFAATPFGRALLASTERGLCNLAFVDPTPEDEVLADARRHWPRARWIHDTAHARRLAATIFSRLDDAARPAPLSVLVRGTNFQINVWRALLRLSPGTLTTYSHIAAAAGRPHAVRAAASAIGANPVAWLIPCHRVIRAEGTLGGYRWGLERKTAIIAWEHARVAP